MTIIFKIVFCDCYMDNNYFAVQCVYFLFFFFFPFFSLSHYYQSQSKYYISTQNKKKIDKKIKC